jgi:hypothetical protein
MAYVNPDGATIQPNQSQETATGNESLGTGTANIGKTLIPSIGGIINSIGQTILHPIQTGKALLNMGIGALSPQAAGEEFTPGTTPAQAQAGKNIVPQKQSQQFTAFDNFGNNFLGGALYGKGGQGAWAKLQNDPAGFATDLAIMGDTASAGLKGTSIISDDSKIAKIAEGMTPAQAPFETMSSALEKMGAPKAGAAENAATLKELGVEKPPIQALTNSPTLQRVSQFISEGFFGKGLKTAVDSTKETLDNKVNETIGSLPKALDNPDLGQKLIDAKANFEKTFNDNKNALYNDFEAKYGDTPATVESTQAAIQKQIETLRNSATPDSNRLINYLQKTSDALVYGKEKAAEVRAALVDEEKGLGGFVGAKLSPEDIKSRLGIDYKPTFDTLKSTRSSIGALVGKDNANSWVFKPIYKALSDDRDASLGNVSSDAASKIKEMDNYYKGTIDKLGTNVSAMLDRATPEQVVQNLIKGNNSTTLNALKDIVDKQTYNNIGLSWIKDSVTRATDPASGEVDIGKLAKNFNGLDDPTKNALFTPEQISKLDSTVETLQKVQKIQGNLEKYNNAGGFMRNSMVLRGMGLPLTAMLGGGKFMMTYLAGMMGGEFMGSKILTSDLGKAILTTGSPALQKAGEISKVSGEIVGTTSKLGNISKETK